MPRLPSDGEPAIMACRAESSVNRDDAARPGRGRVTQPEADSDAVLMSQASADDERQCGH